MTEYHSIAVQFMDDKIVALFELIQQGDDIRIVEEGRCRLVPAEEQKPDTRLAGIV